MAVSTLHHHFRALTTMSPLQYQKQIRLQTARARIETAWMMLHKFRRAMINTAREPLRGEVEVDETWIGGAQAGLQGSRQLKEGKRLLSSLPSINGAV